MVATLMLVAIAVAVSIVFYIFAIGLMSSFAAFGGSQVTEQLSMDSYSSTESGSTWTLTVTLRNTGTAPVSISSTSVYYDGSTTVAALTTFSGACTSSPCAPSPQGFPVSLTISASVLSPTPHSSHTYEVVTDAGAAFAFKVIAEQSH